MYTTSAQADLSRSYWPPVVSTLYLTVQLPQPSYCLRDLLKTQQAGWQPGASRSISPYQFSVPYLTVRTASTAPSSRLRSSRPRGVGRVVHYLCSSGPLKKLLATNGQHALSHRTPTPTELLPSWTCSRPNGPSGYQPCASRRSFKQLPGQHRSVVNALSHRTNCLSPRLP